MKILTAVNPSIVLCVGLTLHAFAADGPVPGGPSTGEAMVPSVDFHEDAIQQHQDEAAVLEQKIQRVAHRLDMVMNSYRDPKGFRSASWKRLIGLWHEELKDIRQRIVWHQEQITQLAKNMNKDEWLTEAQPTS